MTLGGVSGETVVTATSNKYRSSVLAREGLSSQVLVVLITAPGPKQF